MKLLRKLFRKGRTEPQEPADPHAFSQAYWKSCSDSFLGGDDYYQAVEDSLHRDIFPRLGKQSRILDIGCGNGHFTFMFARACPGSEITAVDLSPDLIAQARHRAREDSVRNISFDVKDCLEPGALDGDYDWVLCMGVAATIIDEEACAALLRAAAERVRSGGFLLLRESMSMSGEPVAVNLPHYCAYYRTLAQFEELVGSRGLRLIDQHPLKTWDDEGTINKFLLFAKSATSSSS
ncbi:MAG: class I SAM-dependent methyltransferase [Gammaproteobacteria bacterium]|nr:class I SAM-dependent methyltransferase [Gammaproteobacteria bacterium]